MGLCVSSDGLERLWPTVLVQCLCPTELLATLGLGAELHAVMKALL